MMAAMKVPLLVPISSILLVQAHPLHLLRLLSPAVRRRSEISQLRLTSTGKHDSSLRVRFVYPYSNEKRGKQLLPLALLCALELGV